MNQIEFRTDHRFSDVLALQLFFVRTHFLRRGIVMVAYGLGIVAIASLMNGGPLVDSLSDLKRNAGLYVTLVLLCLAFSYIIALLLALLAWWHRPKPRQIGVAITTAGITVQKDGLSYGAQWSVIDLIVENRAAYLLKFNRLYMRLPKRGFLPGDEAVFRETVSRAVPKAASRLRS